MGRDTAMQTDFSVDRIERELVHRILVGIYPANHALPSLERLCSEFNVSFNTARSAIGRLAARGLVLALPGHGARVIDVQSSLDLPLLTLLMGEMGSSPGQKWTFVAQVCGFLRFLHHEMADRAALHRTEKQLEWLRHLVRLLDDRLGLGCRRSELGECEHQFSRVLAAASGNVVHVAIINSLRSMFLSEHLIAGSSSLFGVNDYWALTEALAMGDAVRARQLVDAAWWRHEERAIEELKRLGWTETPGGRSEPEQG